MYPEAYMEYLVHFHGDRDYFECHEILEEYWKEEGKSHRYWVGLIQIAVALYHQRRGNFDGAGRMLQSAIQILSQESLESLGLDKQQLMDVLHNRLTDIQHKRQYQSINLPIHDEKLLEHCNRKALELGLTWGAESDFTNTYLIHKHTLRDRCEVVEERKRQLRLKKGQTPKKRSKTKRSIAMQFLFRSPEHFEAFNSIRSEFTEDLQNDKEYLSVLFIATSHPELQQKMLPYLDYTLGIFSHSDIFSNEELSPENHIMAQLAVNLFNNGIKLNVFDLSQLSNDNLELALSIIRFRFSNHMDPTIFSAVLNQE